MLSTSSSSSSPSFLSIIRSYISYIFLSFFRRIFFHRKFSSFFIFSPWKIFLILFLLFSIYQIFFFSSSSSHSYSHFKPDLSNNFSSSSSSFSSDFLSSSQLIQREFCQKNFSLFQFPHRQKSIRFSPNVTFGIFLFAFGRDIVSQEILSGRGWDLAKSRGLMKILSGENPKNFMKSNNGINEENIGEDPGLKEFLNSFTPTQFNFSSFFSRSNTERKLFEARKLFQSKEQIKYLELQKKKFGGENSKNEISLDFNENQNNNKQNPLTDEKSNEKFDLNRGQSSRSNFADSRLSQIRIETENKFRSSADTSLYSRSSSDSPALRDSPLFPGSQVTEGQLRDLSRRVSDGLGIRYGAAESILRDVALLAEEQKNSKARIEQAERLTNISNYKIFNNSVNYSQFSYWNSKFGSLSPSSFTLTREIFVPNPSNRDIIFLDIGSNIGWFSLLAASLNFSVVAIEPLQMNAQLFRRSICLNSAKNFIDKIYFLQTGLAESRQICHMYSHSRNQGDGHVLCKETKIIGEKSKIIQKLIEATSNPSVGVSTSESSTSSSPAGSEQKFSPFAREYRIRQTIELLTLDEILLPFIQREKKRVGLVKIDVEGFEFHVMKGAKKLLGGGHLPLISMEFAPKMLQEKGSNPLELLSFMKEFGYEIYLVKKNFNLSQQIIEIEQYQEFCAMGAVCEIFLIRPESNQF